MRLIDADVFEKFIRKNCTDSLVDLWCELVRRQPTAYDVDKVVEQLEELKSEVPVNRILDDIIKDKPKELGQLIAYNKAIEIVKGGGVDER
mgnify:CR=1 FL=1|jgi:hypothetical protein